MSRRPASGASSCVEFARALDGCGCRGFGQCHRPGAAHRRAPDYSEPFARASYTGPYNLTGSPALSVPIGFEDGLPLAFQIVGRPFDEAGVMRVGHAFEQATEFHRQRPPIAAPLPGRG